MTQKSKMSKPRKVIFAISCVVLAVCIFLISTFLYRYIKNKYDNNRLADIYHKTTTVTQPSEPQILARFDELLNINSETFGWIEIPAAEVDFPVVQKKDENTGNSYYLKHDFYNKYSKSGAIFADFRDVVTPTEVSDNIVLYGHDNNDGTMFGNLRKYKKLDFYKENPVITFTNLYSSDKYKIIAYFVINNSEKDAPVFDYHNYINLSTQEEFDKYMTEVNARSYMHNDVDVKLGDKFLTLSTCSYEFDDGRLAIIARKVRPGESPDVDVSKAETNPDIKRDPSWYKIYGKK